MNHKLQRATVLAVCANILSHGSVFFFSGCDSGWKVLSAWTPAAPTPGFTELKHPARVLSMFKLTQVHFTATAAWQPHGINMFMLTNWWDKTPNPKLFSFFSIFYLTLSSLLCFWWKTFCSIKWQSREVLFMQEKNVKGEIMSHPFSHEMRDAKYSIWNLLRSWKPLKDRHHREAWVEVLSLEFCVKITQKMRRLTLILLF